MDPYCLLTVGDRSVKGTVCRNGGKYPVWDELIIFATTNEPSCILELMDKDTLTADDTIGVCEIDLQEVEDEGRLVKWYELHYKKKLAGEILVEAVFSKEQCPQETIVYSGKKMVKKEAKKGHTAQKAAAKHIIDYREKPERQRKDKSELIITVISESIGQESSFDPNQFLNVLEGLEDCTC